MTVIIVIIGTMIVIVIVPTRTVFLLGFFIFLLVQSNMTSMTWRFVAFPAATGAGLSSIIIMWETPAKGPSSPRRRGQHMCPARNPADPTQYSPPFHPRLDGGNKGRGSGAVTV